MFCQDILEDTTRNISALGIMDGIQFQIAPNMPDDFPSKITPIQAALNLLIIIRTGDSPGEHDLKLIMQTPSGKRSELSSRKIELSSDPNGGAQLKIRTNLQLYSSGVFWIDLILDGKRITRMPLNVIFVRPEMPAQDAKGTKGKH